MKPRGISLPKQREPRPCHACYRERGANAEYCDACVESGAADFHRRVSGSGADASDGYRDARLRRGSTRSAPDPSSAPPRRSPLPDPPVRMPKPKRKRTEREAAKVRAAEAAREARERRSAERQARDAQREADRLAARQEREEARMRRAVEREREQAAKRRRKAEECQRIAGQTRRGSDVDARRTGNRTRVGSAVTRQRPARTAALVLMEEPGTPRVLHTYRAPENVKAAIWYLRNRVDLPGGVWTFWRDGCSLVGVYEPIHPNVPVSSR